MGHTHFTIITVARARVLAVTSHERRYFLSATHTAIAPFSLIRSRKNWSRIAFLNLYWWRTLVIPPASAGVAFVLNFWSFRSSHFLSTLMWRDPCGRCGCNCGCANSAQPQVDAKHSRNALSGSTPEGAAGAGVGVTRIPQRTSATRRQLHGGSSHSRDGSLRVA